MASIIERNIVGLEALARVAAQKLVNIGFTVTHVDNVASTTITPTSKRIVLSAPAVVDAKVDDEPWAIVFEGQDQGRWLTANIVPTQQILLNGVVAKLDEKVEAGRLSTGANTERYFIDLAAWGVSKDADTDEIKKAVDFIGGMDIRAVSERVMHELFKALAMRFEFTL